ncbi:MAG: PD-(D/E)XK nuclease family protein [Lachnospiraceae bacterium]|nr:PD-(D/E)XK nuclease family protein [Lachnospiraceae bacterium]
MSDLIKSIFDIKRSEPYIAYYKYHSGNIFGITKTSRWELMHSNFINWILNPTSSHALGNYPLYQLIQSLMFIKEKTDNIDSRLDLDVINKFYDDSFIVSTTVECEIEHIDILIQIKTKEKILPVLIENKVNSSENGKNKDQTIVYFNWGESKFSDRDKYFEPIYIFLYPEYSNVIQKEKSYIRMTYQELVDYIIEPSMLKCGDFNSINNFKLYLQCLSFQTDNEKGELTMAISSEERKILDDFITQNKNLLISVLNELKDDVDPEALSQITDSVRDYSKYEFEGNEYGKVPLVLAVVKKYVADYNPKDFTVLQDAFPDLLQGTKGTIRQWSSVSDEDKGLVPNKKKRYFVNEDQLIKLPSKEIVIVCREWGAGNIENFINHVNTQLNYTITNA